MTANRRIFLNVVSTYGRTVVGIACGLLSTRWVLASLGEESFGLYGLVGSLVIFISFLNTQFSSALGRFYAYSIGRAKVSADGEHAIDECRSWFTVGVMIHLILPSLLMPIGYPIGAYAIAHDWLIIPAERVDDCLWLWRFVCLSSFVGMLNVPFNAMYMAKQYIAELTVYSFVQTISRTAFIYYMTTVERDWLVLYGLGMCLVAVTPQLVIACRAMIVFSECRFVRSVMFDFRRFMQIASYAWWQAFAGLGYIARHQALEIVVNKFYGPRMNSAYTVGATVGMEAATLTAALSGAFNPAITTACGSGDVDAMRKLAYRASKFGTFLTLVFAIPLALEAQEVLLLWLKNPPRYSCGLCECWLLVTVIEKLTLGHCLSVYASGKVMSFCLSRGLVCFTAIPFAIIATFISGSVYAIGLALALTTALVGASDVIWACKIVNMSGRRFLHNILLPLVVITVVSGMLGALPNLFMTASFTRIVVTTGLVELSLAPLAWYVLFDSEEREYVILQIQRRLFKH